MARYSFAQLDQWVTKAQARIDAVVKGSTQDVMAVAQTPKAKGGRMPVDTGNLRNSLLSSLSGGGQTGGGESFILIAGSMEGGDVASFRWSAEYAHFVNDGTTKMAGSFFVEGAVDQWQQIVSNNVRRARAAIR